MGFANVRAGTRVLILVLVQAFAQADGSALRVPGLHRKNNAIDREIHPPKPQGFEPAFWGKVRAARVGVRTAPYSLHGF